MPGRETDAWKSRPWSIRRSLCRLGRTLCVCLGLPRTMCSGRLGWQADARNGLRISWRLPRPSTPQAAGSLPRRRRAGCLHVGICRDLAAPRRRRGLSSALTFLGDRADVPALFRRWMCSLAVTRRRDAACHSRSRAAGLPVVVTADNGSKQQIEHGVSGLFVPHASPGRVAAAIERLQVIRRCVRGWPRSSREGADPLCRRDRGPAMAGACRRGDG